MPDVHDLELPDLVAGVLTDARELVEAEVGSLREDLGKRLGDLGSAIKSWLFVVCVAIVTAMMLGIALSATLTQVGGLPWWASLWIVTGLAVGIVFALVLRARANGRKATAPKSESESTN